MSVSVFVYGIKKLVISDDQNPVASLGICFGFESWYIPNCQDNIFDTYISIFGSLLMSTILNDVVSNNNFFSS